MQKKLLTVAVAGALAAPVAAMADVTVYGTIDTGVRQSSKVVTATGDDSLWEVTDGLRTTNRWGLRGSEDLGGGLRANFTLEGQYGSDTGTGPGSSSPGVSTSTGNQGLFQRKSIVGLSGGSWSVDVGRDYTVNFKTQGVYDPMSYTYTGITPTAGNNVAGTRASNMITAGFRFGQGGIRVDYSFGEVVGETGDSQVGINFDYVFGPVTFVVASTARTISNTPVGDLDTGTGNIGIAWKFGSFTLRGGLSNTNYKQSTGGNEVDTPMTVLGLQWAISPQWDARIGYYDMAFELNSNEVGSRDWFIVAVDYVLSKSTRLYAAVDRAGIEGTSITVNGSTGAITTGTAGTGSVAGSTVRDGSTGLSLGIAHTF